MASSAATMLGAFSGLSSDELIAYVKEISEQHNRLLGEFRALQQEVTQLRASQPPGQAGGQAGGIGGGQNKNLKELKGFQDVTTWDGNEVSFGDWEFKLHQFLQP